MGFLDAILGRKKLPPSKTAQLGQIASAELTIGSELAARPAGQAGLAIKAVAASEFERVREDVRRMLELAGEDLGSRSEMTTDEYGYVWAVVADPDFPDLVAAMQIAAESILQEGFADRLLCAVFPFATDGGQPLHLVYAFKRGAFYAFAPRRDKTRDVTLELRAHALLEGELPLEREMEYRYPLWGLPLGLGGGSRAEP